MQHESLHQHKISLQNTMRFGEENSRGGVWGGKGGGRGNAAGNFDRFKIEKASGGDQYQALLTRSDCFKHKSDACCDGPEKPGSSYAL